MSNCFIFDLNKCVGCHACVVACSIENKTPTPAVWREISTYNQLKHPAIPLFHFSLACNHCETALCMSNCPALAYTRDKVTGAIIHQAEKCIGCKYCTWACPYDAPKFNVKTQIVDKCTFCNERLKSGLKPACASLCPTGALDFNMLDKTNLNRKMEEFTDLNLSPSIKIIPLTHEKPEIEPIACTLEDLQIENPPSKISFKREWELAIFSILVATLTGVISSTIISSFTISPWLFLSFGIIGFLLASRHLGKKFKAYRSILNLRESWLSREIACYTGFLFSAFIQLFFYPNSVIWTCITTFFGFTTLISIDMVYHLALKTTKIDLHSAQVVLTGILFTGLFMKNFIIFSFICIIKLGLYIYRKWYFKQINRDYRIIISAWRVVLLTSIPLIILWLVSGNVFWYVAFSIYISEVIDRFEFYNELEIITPKKQMHFSLMKKLLIS